LVGWSQVNCGHIAVQIEMLFGLGVGLGKGNVVSDMAAKTRHFAAPFQFCSYGQSQK